MTLGIREKRQIEALHPSLTLRINIPAGPTMGPCSRAGKGQQTAKIEQQICSNVQGTKPSGSLPRSDEQDHPPGHEQEAQSIPSEKQRPHLVPAKAPKSRAWHIQPRWRSCGQSCYKISNEEKRNPQAEEESQSTQHAPVETAAVHPTVEPGVHEHKQQTKCWQNPHQFHRRSDGSGDGDCKPMTRCGAMNDQTAKSDEGGFFHVSLGATVYSKHPLSVTCD